MQFEKLFWVAVSQHILLFNFDLHCRLIFMRLAFYALCRWNTKHKISNNYLLLDLILMFKIKHNISMAFRLIVGQHQSISLRAEISLREENLSILKCFAKWMKIARANLIKSAMSL